MFAPPPVIDARPARVTLGDPQGFTRPLPIEPQSEGDGFLTSREPILRKGPGEKSCEAGLGRLLVERLAVKARHRPRLVESHEGPHDLGAELRA